MRFAALTISALLLASCATFGDLDKGLNALVGQPQDAAFRKIGYPAGQMKIGEDTVYAWGRNFNMTLPQTTTSTTQGSVGFTPFRATTTGTAYATHSYNCDIKIVADRNGIIKDWSYDGNLGGCESFIKNLRPEG